MEKKFWKVLPTSEERNDFVIIVGKHLVTSKHFKSEEDANEYMQRPKWDTIVGLVAEMLDIHDEKEQIKSKEK